jgi:hypothetical protein
VCVCVCVCSHLYSKDTDYLGSTNPYVLLLSNCTYKDLSLSLFSVAITKCPRLGNLQRKEVYLGHNSGGCEVQRHDSSIWPHNMAEGGRAGGTCRGDKHRSRLTL